MCNAVYFNPLANFNQSYTPYENGNQGNVFVRLNTVVLTTVESEINK